MTARFDLRQWEDGRVPRQPDPVAEIRTCDVCGGDAGDWRVIDERRWIIACPKCCEEIEDADPGADLGDWQFHQDHDQ